MYCEHCGLQVLPKRPVCSRCGVSPTHHWFQLMSLVTLAVAVVCNALIGWFFLPRMVATHPAQPVFRAWLWLDQKGSLYGWAPLALGLLVWDYFLWKSGRPKIRGWVTRKLLTLVLVAGITPIIPWWLPAGQPPQRILSALASHAGFPTLVAWGIVLVVLALVCMNSETRERLLGRGKALSLVSLLALLLILGMTLFGWSLS